MGLGGLSMSGYPINARQRSGAHQYINSPQFDNAEDFMNWWNMTQGQNQIGRVMEDLLLIDPMGNMPQQGELPSIPTNFQTGQPGTNDMTGGPGSPAPTTNNQGGYVPPSSTSTNVPLPSDSDIQAALDYYGVANVEDLAGQVSQEDLNYMNQLLGTMVTGNDVMDIINDVMGQYGINSNDPIGNSGTSMTEVITTPAQDENVTDLYNGTVNGGSNYGTPAEGTYEPEVVGPTYTAPAPAPAPAPAQPAQDPMMWMWRDGSGNMVYNKNMGMTHDGINYWDPMGDYTPMWGIDPTRG